MIDAAVAFTKQVVARAATAPPSESKSLLAKLAIVNLDEIVSRDQPSDGIVAQYNPKEIQVEHQVTWNPSTTNQGDHPELTFGGGSARSLQIELFFDTFEPDPVSGKVEDVHEKYVKHVQALMLVMSTSRGEEMQRPPRVQLLWGDDLPRFIGVVASVSTKYTMFLPGGRPVRATCTVKMIEADRGSFDRKAKH